MIKKIKKLFRIKDKKSEKIEYIEMNIFDYLDKIKNSKEEKDTFFSKIEDFYYKVKFKLHDIWIDDISHFWTHLKRVISWIPVIWNDRQWDFYYMLKIELKKIESMIKYYQRANYLVDGSPRIAQELQLCKFYIEEYLNDNHAEEYYIDKFDLYDYDLIRKVSASTHSDVERYINVIKEWQEKWLDGDKHAKVILPSIREDLYKSYCIYMYNNIRNKCSQGWWD